MIGDHRILTPSHCQGLPPPVENFKLPNDKVISLFRNRIKVGSGTFPRSCPTLSLSVCDNQNDVLSWNCLWVNLVAPACGHGSGQRDQQVASSSRHWLTYFFKRFHGESTKKCSYLMKFPQLTKPSDILHRDVSPVFCKAAIQFFTCKGVAFATCAAGSHLNCFAGFTSQSLEGACWQRCPGAWRVCGSQLIPGWLLVGCGNKEIGGPQIAHEVKMNEVNLTNVI